MATRPQLIEKHLKRLYQRESAMSKCYYWLKLNENFFEREEIKIIEDMPNGKDYIIFYLKLLLKAIKTEGRLIFREVIPYTPNMLASITGTDIDTVRVATELFLKLGLMEKWDDGTLFMVEVQNMVGSETASARRVRKHRERKKIQEQEIKALHGNGDETKSNTEIEIEIEKDIEIDKEREGEIEKDKKSTPTFYGEYKNVRLSKEEYKNLKEKLNSHTEIMINKLSRYMESSGKTYQNHYVTILKWYEEDKDKLRQKGLNKKMNYDVGESL